MPCPRSHFTLLPLQHYKFGEGKAVGTLSSGGKEQKEAVNSKGPLSVWSLDSNVHNTVIAPTSPCKLGFSHVPIINLNLVSEGCFFVIPPTSFMFKFPTSF